ncbi:MAG TPA: nuclear transport factor 2 family protein [Pedococcus sp.]|jgi:ketosteroid isomerase-like protein
MPATETPESTVRSMFDAFDAMDIDTMLSLLAPDAQGVDEIARRWLRSADDVSSYVRELRPRVRDVRSELTDVHTREWGDVALVTAWLEQDYTFDDEPLHIAAPTTALLRRDGDGWLLTLLHSVALPPE